jgi:hypothetical protein
MAKTDKAAYGKIQKVDDLVKLTNESQTKIAVGVTENGSLYIINQNGGPEAITPDRALSILGVSLEELKQIISSRGTVEFERFNIKEEIVVDTPTAIEINQDEQVPTPVAQEAEEAKIEAEDDKSKQEDEQQTEPEPETVTIGKERYDELIECETKKDEALENLEVAENKIQDLEHKLAELEVIKQAAKTIAKLFQ